MLCSTLPVNQVELAEYNVSKLILTWTTVARALLVKGIFKPVFSMISEQKNNLKAFKLDETEKYVKRSPEDVLTTYGDSMLRLAFSYMHQISDAEDIVQEVLIKYIEKDPKINSENHEKAWLLRVTGNECKNKIKHNKIRQTSQLEESTKVFDNVELNYVWDAIKNLPDKYREVIHLYYQEGYSTTEVAKLLSKKESTVRSLMRRARKNLKDVLREEYDFEE